MRKKTFNHSVDTIFWYLLYLMPLIFMAINFIHNQVVSFDTFFNVLGITIDTNNIVYTSLINLFGIGGILPLFTDNGIFIYLTYFIFVFIMHLAVDFILFVPRLAHKFLNIFTHKE